MPRLQVLNGKRQGATFHVGRAGAVVGHRNTAPISIDDPWVSWDHARLLFHGDGFWVEDLGSTNGTYIGTVRITQPTTITLGTQVRIGKTILELRK